MSCLEAYTFMHPECILMMRIARPRSCSICRNFNNTLIQLTFDVTFLFYDKLDHMEYLQMHYILANFVDLKAKCRSMSDISENVYRCKL